MLNHLISEMTCTPFTVCILTFSVSIYAQKRKINKIKKGLTRNRDVGL